MKVLTDHDVYKITVDFLKQHGHDVITAKELGLHKATVLVNIKLDRLGCCVK